jgi:hypothetical protein
VDQGVAKADDDSRSFLKIDGMLKKVDVEKGSKSRRTKIAGMGGRLRRATLDFCIKTGNDRRT